MLVVPGHNIGADGGGERQGSEKLIDPVLMDSDIFGTEPVEVLAAVLPVVAEERVHHQVAEVQDGPVDIEHDAELLVGVSRRIRS